MAPEATSRPVRRLGARLRLGALTGLRWRAVWGDLWSSRAVVLGAGILALLAIGRAAGTAGFDPTGVTEPYGYFGNLLAAPAARWDSVWYLSIAHGGYSPDPLRTAFFPLYPLLIRCVSILTRSELAAGVLVSVGAFFVALALLERLAALDLDERRARATVTLVAFAPVAYCFSAIYTESLFLALSAGALLAARRDRWAPAGVLGGLAAMTRNSGIVLLVPLVILYLWGPLTLPELRRRGAGALLERHRLRPDVLWLVLVPAGLGAYIAYLALAGLDPAGPFRVEQAWFHHFAGPFGGVWDGTVAAYDGLRQLLHGPPPPVYYTQAGGDPLVVASQNLMLFAFLVIGAVALAGVVRRLPLAYGAYVLITIGLALTYPVAPQPLQSLPRYELVMFPLFMAIASWSVRREVQTRVVACSAVLLGLFTAEFVTWRFVA